MNLLKTMSAAMLTHLKYLVAFIAMINLFSCSSHPAGGPMEPTIEQQRQAENEWVAPKIQLPLANISYQLYDTPARGVNTKGSYLVYLPDGYGANKNVRYPVIYWLHGGFGSQNEGLMAMQNLAKGMTESKMPQAIIVSPHILPMGWYVNSIDGQKPLEKLLVDDLVPHIDSLYRTKSEKRYRAIEGMSMGGYGALRFGLKYPEVFGVVSAFAPSILHSMSEEPSYRTFSTFGSNEADFFAQSPWHLLDVNSEKIAAERNHIRIVMGGNDVRLNKTLKEFLAALKQKNVLAYTQEAPQAGHVYKQIIDELGDENFAFWKKSFQ